MFKCTNIQVIGVLEGEEKEQEIENSFEKKFGEGNRHTSPGNTDNPIQLNTCAKTGNQNSST